MRIEVVTLFPALIGDALRYGVLARAVERGLISVGTEDPRVHAPDAHRTVDDRPYGGGPGMVLKPAPLCAAIAAARQRLPAGSRRIALSAQGEPLTQRCVAALAQLPGLVLIAGRYEGIDERVFPLAVDQELSIGDYVLSGGELPALVLIDALARLQPGALGDERSNVQESFGDGLLDWPHYTRPEVFEGRIVPAVLSSGDHAAIARWRLKQSVGRTWLRRPELIGHRPLDAERSALLQEFLAEQREGAQR
ncbi:MAG TPA: tRNA (guanosine(37)-N1)-methyltransferase TrmD [Steroidobacteraceae bacterium]|jgi:tRNA (guanine37-N1)-methyltransferase|nr:tRNA (guanosine(37)-N1)-methyltransferase TrmD [Steroidobacteraceae bacterium]